MNAEQEAERVEFTITAMRQAIREIEYLHRLLRRETASGPCVILALETSIALFLEEQ